MSEKNDVKKSLVLETIFPITMVNAIYKEIQNSRKCVGDDKFTYDVIEKSHNDKTYVIESRHIPVQECMGYGKSSCNKCYGTGKKIMSVEKSRIQHVEDFVMIASTSFNGLSEEQKKIVIEKEKAAKFWKVLLPCQCTIKNMLKKNMHIVSNDLNNIVIEITCTEKISE